MDLLLDIPEQTDIDTIVSQVVYSWWGNTTTRVGWNINNLQCAFEAKGYGKQVLQCYPEIPRAMKDSSR